MKTKHKAQSTKLQALFRWLDNNILFIFASFLILFIPLWPKIPLFSPIEQYIVRVRLEDIFIFLAAVIWLVQWIRGKIKWRSPMFWLVLSYAGVGLMSTLIAMFVIKTIPLEPLHIGKSFLHYFRYLEYFSLFFIAFSGIKTRKQILIVISFWMLSVFAISAYGYGQKFFYWPVYSTMNREFSKGIRLVLTEHARVQSTFGGHYDMAAYLVILLPLVLAFTYNAQNAKRKTLNAIIFFLGTWLLILSGSRAPFASYIGGVGIVVLITGFQKKKWLHKILFFLKQAVVLGLMLFFLFFYFGSDMIDRLDNIIVTVPPAQKTFDALNNFRKIFISNELASKVIIPQDTLIAWLPKGQKPEHTISTDDIAAAAAQDIDVASLSDLPPVPFKPKPTPTPIAAPANRPSDVYVDVPDIILEATVSATGETTYIERQRPRIYSECALEKELSWCIRQEVLWPRALEGFLINPVTGSGYATLTKESIEQFTEADSTDNNYLRTLGETGILGFIIFYGSIIFILVKASKNLNSQDQIVATLSLGVLAGSIGLLLNAIYIDVFAASKVAQTFWLMTGFYLGFVYLENEDTVAKTKTVKKKKTKKLKS